MGWRNAACLMFLTGPFRFSKAPQKITNPLVVSKSPFIQYKSEQRSEPKILFGKRHSKAGFMANVHVFPGGVMDKADYSPGWVSLFTDHGSRAQPFTSITSMRNAALPIHSSVPQGSPISGEVAFRICAIREFFEEAGILLARDSVDVESILEVIPGSFPPAIKQLPSSMLEEWRARVHNDANQFITMCRELDCVPDIWSLIEWSDWLTPRNYKRRYDTLFFMCFSEQLPDSLPDQVEVTGLKWITPSQVDESFKDGTEMFAPPQFAEIRKMQSIGDVPLLHLFALHQSTKNDGIYCKKSARMLTQDNIILSVTHLDDLWPLNSADCTAQIQLPQSPDLQRHGVTMTLSLEPNYEYKVSHTSDELRELSTNINRMEYNNLGEFVCSDTIEIEMLHRFTRMLTSQITSKM